MEQQADDCVTDSRCHRIGEKVQRWTDPSTTPSTDHILEWLTLWWLTSTFPRSIYPYRHRANEIPDDLSDMYIGKPTGFSWFPYELMPVPRAWVEGGANVVLYREHEKGEWLENSMVMCMMELPLMITAE